MCWIARAIEWDKDQISGFRVFANWCTKSCTSWCNSPPSNISHLPADQGRNILHHLANGAFVHFRALKFYIKKCVNWTQQQTNMFAKFLHQIMSVFLMRLFARYEAWRVNCLRWCRSMGGQCARMPKDIRQLNLIYQVAQPRPTFQVNKYSSVKTRTSWTFSTRLNNLCWGLMFAYF